MTTERLNSLPLESLQEFCRREHISLENDSDRDELIRAILEATEEDRQEQDSLNNLIIKIEQSKFSLFQDDMTEIPSGNRESLEIPEHYDENYVGLLLRDPFWAYVYWELRHQDWDRLQNEPDFQEILLKVHESVHGQDFVDAYEIPLGGAMGSRYISLPNQGAWYKVELVARLGEVCQSYAVSESIHVPLDGPAYSIAEGAEGQRMRRILELSGWDILEPKRNASPGGPGDDEDSDDSDDMDY